MKTMNQPIKALALLLLCIGTPSMSHAQYTITQTRKPVNYAQKTNSVFYNVDWQMNLPVGNSFADRISDWGAHGEVGYFVTPKLSVGGFMSFHSNNKYIDRKSLIINETSTLTSDQQHHIFQLPFGAAFRYRPCQSGMWEPYLGLKLGTNYSDISTQMNLYNFHEYRWGFFASQEIGATRYLTPDKKLGLHMAVYYNYSTNSTKLLNYSISGMDNLGLRVGLAF